MQHHGLITSSPGLLKALVQPPRSSGCKGGCMATEASIQVRAVQERSMHVLGVVCGLAAGVWLGAAEAPTKLANIGLSPFAVSLCMVAGVFVARWSFPTLLRGTGYVYQDLRTKKHLIFWAVLAGALWSVANTLTVYAVRDVGLTIAFPL